MMFPDLPETDGAGCEQLAMLVACQAAAVSSLNEWTGI
ncbi:hypothetical protein X975_12299, partial [Stegodyphus mimosarum]